MDTYTGDIVRVENNQEYEGDDRVYDLIIGHEVVCFGMQGDRLVKLRNFMNGVIAKEELE